MNNKCPITGKVCHHLQAYQITEIEKGKVTRELKLCDKCLASYLNDSGSIPKKNSN